MEKILHIQIKDMVLSWSASDKYKVKNTWNLLYSSTITAKTVTSSPNSTSKSGPFFGKKCLSNTPRDPNLNSSGAPWTATSRNISNYLKWPCDWLMLLDSIFDWLIVPSSKHQLETPIYVMLILGRGNIVVLSLRYERYHMDHIKWFPPLSIWSFGWP